jgi:hypothetical protein
MTILQFFRGDDRPCPEHQDNTNQFAWAMEVVLVSAQGGYLDQNQPNPFLKETCKATSQKFKIVPVPDGSGGLQAIRDVRSSKRTCEEGSRLVALMGSRGDFLSARRSNTVEWRDRMCNFEHWEMTMMVAQPNTQKKGFANVYKLKRGGSVSFGNVLLVLLRSAHGKYVHF